MDMPRPIILACAAALAVSAASLPSRADETRPLVPVQTAERPAGPDPLLVTTGVVMFGLPYAGSAVAAGMSEIPADRWLYVPVVGPFADLLARDTCQDYGCRGNLGTVALPLVMSGLLQAGGAAVLLRSLAATHGRASPPPAGAQVHVVPAAYAGGAGVGAFGSF
jgi:hypothetical protein